MVSMPAKYFFSFTISFIAGVAVESMFNLGYAFAVFCALISIIIYFTTRGIDGPKNVILVSLVLFGSAVGILRVDVSHKDVSNNSLKNLVDVVIQAEGKIVDEPDVREAYANVVLEMHTVLYKEKQNIIDDYPHILVRVPVYPELHYGDNVSLVGKITIPKNFAPKGDAKAFDYQAYLSKDDIYYQMYFPKVTVVSHGNGNVIFGKLFDLKYWLMKNISENIPEPEASLAGGITLGTKQSLGDELLQKFRETGVAHIVVLSGYNIAVVAGIISRLVIFMPFTLRLAMSALGIVLFSMMVGGGATVVRATIMALIIILARVLGRDVEALRALVLAGALMIFQNPMILLSDISFQLSFSATLALVTLVPVIEKYAVFISNKILREIIITTFATQIFILPLILYHMGSVSLIGLIANIFILPIVPLAMLAVALVATFAWLPVLSNAFFFCAYFLLAYIFLAVDFFAQVPFTSLKGIKFPFSALVCVYVLLGYFIIKNYPNKNLANKSPTRLKG